MICDVSKWQGDIDWSKLAPALDFVILRSSCGMNPDTRYHEYVKGCEQYGVPYHAYHYIKATDEAAARTEAKVMSEACAETSPLFYVIDAEYSGISASRARSICEAFENGLRHYISPDIRVALYIGHHLYKPWALDYSRYAYLWIPRYGKNTGKPETRPDYPCDLWQYTSAGTAPGISGNVDLNMIIGDKPLSFFTGNTEPTKEVDTGMLTGKQLAEYCEKVYKAGWVYWYGTYGNKCTTSLYNSKRNQYPAHYTDSRKSGYEKDIKAGKRCADCVGMIKSFFWTGGKFDTDPKYGSNGCPDKSANGMIEYCSETGPIKTIPDEPGLVVWKSGHIGVYVGDGYTVEMKGFDYDCKRVKVTAGPWTKWGRLPKSMITYTDEPVAPTETLPEGLSKGDHGSAVTAMQEALLRWNPDCLPRYGADSDFGSETEKALCNFQTSMGLPATGIYDEATRAALTSAEKHETPSDLPPEIVTGPKYIHINEIHVRSAPGDNYMSLGTVQPGDRLLYQGDTRTDANGTLWYLVIFDNQNGWISEKYSKVVG